MNAPSNTPDTKTLIIPGDTPEELAESLEDHAIGLNSLCEQAADSEGPKCAEIREKIRHFEQMAKLVVEFRLKGPLNYVG